MSWYTGSRAMAAMVALLLPALLGLGALPASAVVLPGSTSTGDDKVIVTCPGAPVPPPGPRVDDGGVTLREAAERHGIWIGSALPAWQHMWTNQQGRDVAAAEFNIVNSSNQMFWGSHQGQREVFNFCNGDQFVALARANGQTLRGHALVHRGREPQWLRQGDFSREELIEILREYIHTVVGHYRGDVAVWDVVSEAIKPDGSLQPGVLAEGIGPEYIELAFRFAHEADPDALLMYDDFGMHRSGAKQDAVFELVEGLVADGVPVHIVGTMMFNVDPVALGDMSEVRAMLDRYGALGVETAITQITVPLIHDWHTRQHQATAYRNALDACLTAASCRMFNTWGYSGIYHTPTQAFAQLQGGHNHGRDPYLWDELYRRKPAYHALRERLLEAVVSEVSFTGGSDGSGQHSDPVALEARLVDARGVPIPDQELTFEIAGHDATSTLTGTTDPDGIATVEATLEEPAGTYRVTAAFTGDDHHRAATATGELTVHQEDSVTELTVTGVGAGRTLDARLSDLDTPSRGIEGRTLSFLADGQPVGEATTGADGVATFTPPYRYWAGSYTFEARYAGDDRYLPSSDQRAT